MVLKVVVMLLVIITFILLDLIPMAKNREYKEFWLYLTMMIAIFVFSIMLGMDANIPSPTEPLRKIVSSIWGLQK